MKVMIKVFFTLVLLIMVVSCATTPSALPEKYDLDNELEAVDRIFTITSPRWQKVDSQSVILRVDHKDYYLLVLRQPMDKRYSNPRIGISRTVSSITPGIERVFVNPSEKETGYVIEKIYKLKGREQAEEIKERFRED